MTPHTFFWSWVWPARRSAPGSDDGGQASGVDQHGFFFAPGSRSSGSTNVHGDPLILYTPKCRWCSRMLLFSTWVQRASKKPHCEDVRLPCGTTVASASRSLLVQPPPKLGAAFSILCGCGMPELYRGSLTKSMLAQIEFLSTPL